MGHVGVMDARESPTLTVRLAVLAFFYAIGLVGLVTALNRLVQ